MKTICVDFDGVIHQNLKWLSVANIKGSPVEGSLEALEELSKSYTVLIHSARCSQERGYDAVRAWLEAHGMGGYEVVRDKPVATMYIDDRGIRFDGNWSQTLKDVAAFKQWQTDTKIRNRIMAKRTGRGRR